MKIADEEYLELMITVDNSIHVFLDRKDIS